MKVPKLNSNLSTKLLNLEPGQLLFLDFAFINSTSARGFSSYLTVTDDTTGYTFSFPARNKRAPVDFVLFLVFCCATNKDRYILWGLMKEGNLLGVLKSIKCWSMNKCQFKQQEDMRLTLTKMKKRTKPTVTWFTANYTLRDSMTNCGVMHSNIAHTSAGEWWNRATQSHHTNSGTIASRIINTYTFLAPQCMFIITTIKL